jgi:hypothetical protein
MKDSCQHRTTIDHPGEGWGRTRNRALLIKALVGTRPPKSRTARAEPEFDDDDIP